MPDTSEPLFGPAANPDSSEFPGSIGKVARRELAQHGIVTYERVTRYSAKELLSIHGVGPKAIRILRGELAKSGRDLAS